MGGCSARRLRSVSSGTSTGSIEGIAASAGLLPLASGTITAIWDCRLEGTLVVTGTYGAVGRLGGGSVDEAGLDAGTVTTAGGSVCTGAVVTTAVPVEPGADATGAGLVEGTAAGGAGCTGGFSGTATPGG